MPKPESHKKRFTDGFVSGIGWSFGATVGFALISTLIVVILNYAGGLPIVGSLIANIVEETQVQLLKRSLVIPNY